MQGAADVAQGVESIKGAGLANARSWFTIRSMRAISLPANPLKS